MDIKYKKYSDYLKNKYGEKVYKLPVNLPITCPNRIGEKGCAFCSDLGTGFEAASADNTVSEQLSRTRDLIRRKYHAEKYIAYFQNYTNTFLPVHQFKTYLLEAVNCDGIVEVSISTRPDCIRKEYLDVLQELKETYKVGITIELGLQTVNYRTLDLIQRGHGLAEFIDAVLMIKPYGFSICTHIILNLPNDTLRDSIESAKIISSLHIDIVKLHSLYIAKNTILSEWYLDGTIAVCSKKEYFKRVQAFLEYLDPDIVVERLFSRIPEKDAQFCNWNSSWWKLQEELLTEMDENNSFQGKQFDYLNGAALNKLKQEE